MTETFAIVDDDKAFAMLLDKLVRKHASIESVGTYHTVLDAVDGLNKKKPDLLFLDMKMDVLDGLYLMSLLDTKTKVIVISSSSDYKERASILNVKDYILKTEFNSETLRRSLEKVL